MNGYFLLEVVVALTLLLGLLYLSISASHSNFAALKQIELQEREEEPTLAECLSRSVHDDTLIHCHQHDSKTLFLLGS